MAARTKERSRARWGLVLALVLGLGALGAVSPAQAANGYETISGSVIGDDGNVPAYVSINAEVVGMGGYGGTQADSTGHFSLDVPDGQTYRLTIYASSFGLPGGGAYGTQMIDVTVGTSDVALDSVTMVRQMACSTKTVVTGSLRVGGTLTATAGTVAPADVTPTVTYTWTRLAQDDSGIDSAVYATPLTTTGPSYTLTAADEGAQIQVQTSVSAPGRGTASCTPLLTRAVAAALPVATVATPSVPGTTVPAIAGRHKVGKKLTAQAAAPGATTSYQWLRNGKAVPGATGATFKITKASRGKRISVVVTYTRAGYAPVVVASPVTKIKK